MHEHDLFQSTIASLGNVQQMPARKYASTPKNLQRTDPNKSENCTARRVVAEGVDPSCPAHTSNTLFTKQESWNPMAPEAIFSWSQPSTSSRLRELKQGKMHIESVVDLHGYTLAEAGAVLAEQLAGWTACGMRVTRLIHGKGSVQSPSIIKAHIPLWLQGHRSVLAYCSAPRHLGGSGATLVLLRKHI